MHLPQIAEFAGLVGVLIVLWAYFLLQTHKVTAHSISYSIANLVASSLILFSLYFAWNLPAALVEIVWAALSIYGIYKACVTKIKQRTHIN